RRLRPGDRIGVGRSLLLFGSDAEIAARMATMQGLIPPAPSDLTGVPPTIPAGSMTAQFEQELDFDLNSTEKVTVANGTLYLGTRALPPLPQKLTPSQAARLSELLDFLHRHLTAATENIEANDEGSRITLSYADWQRVLAVQM